MGLSAPLAESRTNNYSETPNCNQNLDMIYLKKLEGMNSMGHSNPLANSKTNNYYETPYFLYIGQFIDDEKCSNTTATLAKIFHKPVGEENSYVPFRYGP